MWKVKFMDIAFMVGGFLFTIALIPAIIAIQKPPIETSGLIGGVLYVYALALGLNKLWLGFASILLTALAWTILFVQVI